jgi:hypothetical protein
MEYLVSAENTLYHHWQLELLIESFKFHNSDNDLLVCLSEENTTINPHFYRNISKHKRIECHENIGKAREYSRLNWLYNLYWAVRYEWIKQPFAYIPVDVVLKNKPNIQFSIFSEIMFCPELFFTQILAEESVPGFWEITNKTKSDYDQWIPIGPVIIFNNIPKEFFQRTIVLAEKLALKQIMENKPIWEHTDRLALAMNLMDFSKQIKMIGDYSLTMNMLDNGNSPFVHYEHGLPPVFNKCMFKFSPPNYVSFGDPFEVLAQHSPTKSSHFVSELAKRSIEARIPLT